MIARGELVVDLISGNVTAQGLQYPPSILERILVNASRAARVYRPHPLGQPEAREAISAYYHSQGVTIPAGRILLTPGTSLAYWYAFSVLCDPGDEILVPRPSYPLCDEIARAAGIHLVPYRLDESRGWAIDVDDLEAHVSHRTRAIILISPHHPTGAVVNTAELEAIAEIAGRRKLPMIADEVFGEFLYGLDALPRPAATRAPLVITLNGFSKLFALPGIKLGWIALSGDAALVAPVTTALETLSDAFLPVNEIVQAAVPEIFQHGEEFLPTYRREIADRRDATLRGLAAAPGLTIVPPRGGFYVAARVTSLTLPDDEALAIHILQSTGCLVHPGFFYDLDPTHLVLSVVGDSAVSGPALQRVVAALSG